MNLIIAIVLSFSSLISAQEYARNIFDGEMRFGPFDKKELRGTGPAQIEEAFNSSFSHKLCPGIKDIDDSFVPLLDKACRGSWRERRCYQKTRDAYIDFLRHRDLIDDQAWLVLKSKSETLPKLSEYFRSLRKLKLAREERGGGALDLSSLYTRDLSVKSNGFTGVSPRQYLYFNYSFQQIIRLSLIAEKMVQVMNSKSAMITVQLSDVEDMEIELSYSEKYRLGVKLAWRELTKLHLYEGFESTPRMIDVLFAGVETGVFQKEALEELIHRPALRDGFRDKSKHYAQILKSLGKAALYNAPVIGQFAAIPVLIWEAYEGIQEDRDAQSRATHLF